MPTLTIHTVQGKVLTIADSKGDRSVIFTEEMAKRPAEDRATSIGFSEDATGTTTYVVLDQVVSWRTTP